MIDTLAAALTKRNLSVLNCIASKPHTKNELYDALPNWNNVLLRESLDFWVGLGIMSGGQPKGSPYRLTLRGQSFWEWVQEGGLVLC